MSVRAAFRSLCTLIFSIYMAYVISPKLSLAFLTAAPILGVLLFVIIRLAFPRFNKVFTEIDELNRVVKENLGGIRVVKAYVQDDYEIEKFEKSSYLEELYVSHK